MLIYLITLYLSGIICLLIILLFISISINIKIQKQPKVDNTEELPKNTPSVKKPLIVVTRKTCIRCHKRESEIGSKLCEACEWNRLLN